MRRSLIAASAASLLLLAACGGGGGSSNGSGGGDDTLTLATVTPPSSFAVGAMAQSGPEDSYYQAVYDKLLRLDDKGEPEADLATEFSFDDAGTTLSLTLREGVTFSDGAVFDADAVKANLDAARAATGEAGKALASISEVTVVDATHVDLVLSRPDPGLLQSLARSSGYMASPDAVGSDDLATNPVGSGPYVLDESATTPGSDYVFTRNADYWDAGSYAYDDVEIKYLDDATAILNGLRSGQINGASTPTADAVQAAKDAGLTVTTYTSGGIEGIYLWDRGGSLVPALADVRVRQAINYAIDRQSIVDTVKGGLGVVTEQVFSPDSDGYDPAIEGTYDFDLDKAKQLMAEAGYADGFSMTLPDFSPVYPNEQAAMTEALSSLGIQVTYSPITGDQVVGSIIGGQWPADFFTLTAGSPYEMIGLTLTPQSPFNPFKSSDPQVDALVQAAYAAPADQQGAALKSLSDYLVDQAWFAPWYALEGAFSTSADVEVTAVPGVSVPPLSSFAPAGS
jgi:peptide/nickel transport system substrate-binding protein